MQAANPSSQTTPSKPSAQRSGLSRLLFVLWVGMMVCLVPLAVSPAVTGFAGVDFAQDYFAARWVLQGDSMYRPLPVEQQPTIFAQDIPRIPIYVDSPLAVNTTDVFRSHPECFDAETQQFVLQGNGKRDPFGFQELHYTRSVEESKQLNLLRN